MSRQFPLLPRPSITLIPVRLTFRVLVLLHTARHSKFPQSPYELRRSSIELPAHSFRYCAVSQGESKYSHPEWYAKIPEYLLLEGIY